MKQLAKTFRVSIELILRSASLSEEQQEYIKKLYSDFTEKLVDEDRKFRRLLWRGHIGDTSVPTLEAT